MNCEGRVTGIFWTLALNLLPILGAYWAARHGLRQPRGLPRFLAAATLAWAWIILGAEVLGSFGLLSRLPLLAWSATGCLVGLGLRVADPDRHEPEPRTEPTGPWEWSAIVGVGLILAAVATLGGLSLLGPVKVVSDGPIYHLYFAARWWLEGRIFGVAAPFGENAATYFPAVGDLGFAWLLVGWDGDRLAKVGQAPFLLLAGLAAYGLARDLGARPSAAALGSAWFLASTPLLLFTFEPNVDTVFAAGYVLSAYFFVRYVLSIDGVASLTLGALSAGGAWGTKPTATVFVPPLLALAGLVIITRRDLSFRRKAEHLAILATSPMVMAGFWFGRNLWLTGNPLYPLDVAAAGRTWLAGWYTSDAMRLSPFYLPIADWGALADTLAAVLDPRLAAVFALAVAGAWAIGRCDALPSRRLVWGCSALTVANVGLYWGLIPYRNQQRFMLHALGLAAVPLALTFDRARWLRRAGAALLTIHVVTPSDWPRLSRPLWDFSPQVPSLLPSLVNLVTRSRSADGGARFALSTSPTPYLVLAASLALSWALARALDRPTRLRRLRAIPALVAWCGVAAATAFTTWPLPPQAAFYAPFPDYYRAWLRLDDACGPGGARVAYAGTNIPYYLLGIDLRNEVRYINVDAHPDWLLHDYHRAAGRPHWPNPRPGWDRAHPNYEAWLANLRAAGIRYLFVAKVDPREGPHNVADKQGFPVERQWADDHPEDFRRFYEDPKVRLYRVLRKISLGSTDRGPGLHY